MSSFQTRTVVVVLAVGMFACGDGPAALKNLDLSGVVQKGPFVAGTAVTVAELNADLRQTGRTFTALIRNSAGRFEVPTLELATPLIQLVANGFYFDEVNGSLSSAPITLAGIADLSDSVGANLNLLSHLELERIRVRMQQDSSLASARRQAQREVLDIFGLSATDVQSFETLDMAGSTEGDGVLIAISAILQGTRTVAELTELLAFISSDFRVDGTLDSPSLGSALVNEAVLLDRAQVRQNLEDFYQRVGLNVTVVDFERHVQSFIDKTDFVFTKLIQYPDNGTHGPNLLAPERPEYTAGEFSFLAVLPKGTRLRVHVSASADWGFSLEPALGDGGWRWGEYSLADKSRVFTATRSGAIELRFFIASGSMTITGFENFDSTATWVRQLTVR